jgi:hypothetical protein
LVTLADQIVSPEYARKLIGWSSASLIDVPAVVADATVPGDGFTAEGHWYPYFDGMQGVARVRTRHTRIASLLLPWLRPLFEPG